MFNAIVRVQQWWTNGRSAGPLVPFELTCACGQPHSGQRRSEPQVLRCTGCGRSLFVFPISPLPPVAGEPTPPAPVAVGRPVWFWPVVGAGVTLLIVTVLFAFLFVYLFPRFHHDRPTAESTADEVKKRWKEGRDALANGNFPKAAQELATAQGIVKDNPALLASAEDRRCLANQFREAELLSSWSGEDGKRGKLLDDILENTNDPDADELKKRLSKYQGKGFCFYARVQADGPHNYRVLEHRRLKVGQVLDLKLQHFKLLDSVPLANPTWLLFGGRLAEARREGKLWEVRLEPDSGVLLTSEEAASICSGQSKDEDLREVIQRQTTWVAKP